MKQRDRDNDWYIPRPVYKFEEEYINFVLFFIFKFVLREEVLY